jgi:hypothetical protein
MYKDLYLIQPCSQDSNCDCFGVAGCLLLVGMDAKRRQLARDLHKHTTEATMQQECSGTRFAVLNELRCTCMDKHSIVIVMVALFDTRNLLAT